MDEHGAEPVYRWLSDELAPHQRRILGYAMKEVLQEEGVEGCGTPEDGEATPEQAEGTPRPLRVPRGHRVVAGYHQRSPFRSLSALGQAPRASAVSVRQGASVGSSPWSRSPLVRSSGGYGNVRVQRRASRAGRRSESRCSRPSPATSRRWSVSVRYKQPPLPQAPSQRGALTAGQGLVSSSRLHGMTSKPSDTVDWRQELIGRDVNVSGLFRGREAARALPWRR